MKRIKRIICCISVLTILQVSFTTKTNAISTNQTKVSPKYLELENVQVDLKNVFTVDEVGNFVKDNGINTMDELIIDDSVNDNQNTTGYVNEMNLSFEEMVKDFNEKYLNLLSESEIAFKDNPELLQGIKKRKLDFIENKGKVKIKALKTKLDQNSINRIKADNTIKYLNKKVSKIYSSKTFNEKALKAPSGAINWRPSSGSACAWVSTNDPNAIYMNLNFKWDNSYPLSIFDTTDSTTLEGEITFYNYDGNALSTKWNTNYVYTTNQPDAYRDTQFCDNDEERVFSIGCSSAKKLIANKTYYWTAYGNKNSNGSMAKISFQRGHKVFHSINSTWNVFPDQTIIPVGFREWNTSSCSNKTF